MNYGSSFIETVSKRCEYNLKQNVKYLEFKELRKVLSAPQGKFLHFRLCHGSINKDS